METRLPIQSRIPEDRVQGGIRWLQIEAGDGGYYLFQHFDIDQAPQWDTFVDDLDELLDGREASAPSR